MHELLQHVEADDACGMCPEASFAEGFAELVRTSHIKSGAKKNKGIGGKDLGAFSAPLNGGA